MALICQPFSILLSQVQIVLSTKIKKIKVDDEGKNKPRHLSDQYIMPFLLSYPKIVLV